MIRFGFKKFFSSRPKDQVHEEREKLRTKVSLGKQKLTQEMKEKASEDVFRKIELMSGFVNANSIAIYWSLKDELYTHDFIEKWCTQKRVYIPAIVKGVMMLKLYTSKVNQEIDSSGSAITNERIFIDLMILPGTIFCKRKIRMGRGSGYYDKFLADANYPKWGVCYDLQLVDRFPVRDFDYKIDKVITPEQTIE